MRSAYPRLAALLAVALVILVLGVLWSRWGRAPAGPAPGPAPPGLTDAEARQLIELAQLGVGQLENEDYAAADEIFMQLGERLPDALLPARNLTITRLRAYEESRIELDQVLEALEKLQAIDPQSPITHWLEGKMHALALERTPDEASRSQSRQLALAAFDEAVNRSPEDPVVQFSIFEATRYASEPQLQQRGHDALAQAARLAPRNLFVLTEWLLAQTQQQDPSVVETLNQIKQLIAPLATGIQKRARVNIHELLDQAIEAAQAGDWSLALPRIRPIVTVIRPQEISKSDNRRITPNPLEYVVHAFQRSFPQQFPPEEPALEVQWNRLPDDPVLGSLDDVRDVVLADFDLDERPDLITLRQAAVEVYTRGAPGEDWTLLVSAPLANQPTRLLVADLDRDTLAGQRIRGDATAEGQPSEAEEPCFEADVELVALGAGGVVVLENRLNEDSAARTLEPIAQPEGLGRLERVSDGALVDFDHDGDLDLVTAAEAGLALWANREDLTFEDASSWSILPPAESRIEWLLPADWDRDVDSDILLGGRSMKPGYLENLRHGELRWRLLDDEHAALDSAAGAAVVDADRNASWDLLAAVPDGLALVRTLTPLPGVVNQDASVTMSAPAAMTLATLDYDNDGWQDAVLGHDQGVSFFRGTPDGSFAAAAELADLGPTSRCVAADLDDDGDLDLAAVCGGRLRFLQNEGGNGNHWLRIQVRGREEEKSGRVNHNGIGSLIEIKFGDAYQAQIVRAQTTHFGLGRRDQANIARVLFTNGIPQAVIQPAADQLICEKMALKGSCPYVYTWSGERFEFYTDLLWSAPLGLQLADGVIAPDRPWEYLKISGERLRENAGQYVLQVTEELWEAAYFDQIELIAVDHPEHLEIFSNEKVGPPEIARFKIHTVAQRRYPVAARDRHGRDVLAAIRHRDGVYLRAFDTTYRQGLAEEHFIELDLGRLDNPRQLVLLLTGWIYPTDTSINIALSQHPTLAAPKPPAVWVPDAQGQWQQVIPYMGFPGGKTKTIAVDLSNVFLADDYRLRIVTSCELYWDEIFFTVDEAPVELRQTVLQLTAADLHYRGLSYPDPPRVNAPETYDYARVHRAQRWPPMEGNFTAYGDVAELLAETDARHVILAAGDELTLRFAAPADPPPEGWTRDFILHNVGWDKDADLNTVLGQSVEPLPFVGMKSYPFPWDQDYPETPLHRRYLTEWQTRRLRPAAFWKQILRYEP